MNKKLLALAVAAALVPAAAMADSGNVTVYGQANVSVDRTDNGTSALGVAGTSALRVSSNASRIGFKGTEDLGNGMAANWQVESQINFDAGVNTFGTRNTYAGLSGKSWGEVRLGIHDTPYKIATRSLDAFYDSIADSRSLMGGPVIAALGKGSAAVAFDGRPANVVAYMSPSMSGFSAAIAYVALAEAAVTSGEKKGDAWSMAGMYSNGPLTGSLAYERHNLIDTGAALAFNSAAVAAADRNEHAWKLGVGYTMDAFKVGFVYEKTGDDFGSTAACVGYGGSATSADCLGHNAWTLNGAYTMGSNVIKAAYTRAGTLSDVANTGASQWALGVDHNMSKRTSVYALYTKLNNDSAADYALGTSATGFTTGASPASGVGGADPSAWSFGMKHSF